MRRYLLSTFLFASLPFAAHAQNYIPSNSYSGAGVVVNMDVLNASVPSGGVAPIMSQNLPPVAPPIALRPPQPIPAQVAPIEPPITAPVYTPPPAPTASPSPEAMPTPSYIAPSIPSGSANGRQELGSLHDTAEDETPAAMPPAAPPIAQNASDEMMPSAGTPIPPPAMTSPLMDQKPVTPSPATIAAPTTTVTNAGDNFEAYRLFFDASSDVLKPSETVVLDKIAAKLNSDQSLRLQVRAYAAGNAASTGAARRLSLSRSLKVRNYLTEKGIATTRLDVRALGSGSMEMGDQASSSAPADRVDVIFSK